MARALPKILLLATGCVAPAAGISKDVGALSSDSAVFDIESSAFLCSLGMSSACEAMHAFTNVSTHPSFIQQSPSNVPCVSTGQVIFHHVMKSGGVSVRNYLECYCQGAHCGIWRDDGHRDLDPYLDSRCPPAICTTHADYEDVLTSTRCGPEFAHAKSFTMMRDPVERVWSFYNYVRRYYKPFKERSLQSILARLGHEDLDAGLQDGERCKYCADQLSNHMVRAQFCGLSSEECESMKHELPDARMLRMSSNGAKVVLQRMSAIFFFDDISNFGSHAQAAGVLPQSSSRLLMRQSASQCDMTQFNPTNYTATGTSDRPDAATLRLIRRANSFDIKLYKWSKTLEAARSSKMLPPQHAQLTRMTAPTSAWPRTHSVAVDADDVHVQKTAQDVKESHPRHDKEGQKGTHKTPEAARSSKMLPSQHAQPTRMTAPTSTQARTRSVAVDADGVHVQEATQDGFRDRSERQRKHRYVLHRLLHATRKAADQMGQMRRQRRQRP